MTKDIFRVPLVAWHDYDAFRELVKDAPSVHHEWAEHFRKRSVDERRRGHVVREIHVDPHKLAAYAQLKGYAMDSVALEHFLIESDPHNG